MVQRGIYSVMLFEFFLCWTLHEDLKKYKQEMDPARLHGTSWASARNKHVSIYFSYHVDTLTQVAIR